MAVCQNLIAIIDELAQDARQVDGVAVEQLGDLILNSRRIFIAGAGRSGFAARAFANRLMHLGFTVYFVGEPTTPSIQRGDLLVIGSGSGETASLVTMANKAVKQGAKLATLTIFPQHTIGGLSAARIVIPGVTQKSSETSAKAASVQPSGSSFEQLSWLIYDSIIIRLKAIKQQTDEQMYYRHANLE